MRIGIDYRITAQGNSVINRGMGRYTQQQLREVLRLDQTNEYILFCYPNSNTTTILPEIRSAPNVQIAYIQYPSLKSQPDPHIPEYTLRHTAEFMDWVYQQKVDVYHLTIPFLYDKNLIPFYFDACPTVITIYDLIPFIFPDKYLLPGYLATSLYYRVLHSLRSADRLVAISESARHDAIHYLGFPEDRIDLAYPVADPCFHVLEPHVVQERLQALDSRVKIPDSFVLSISDLHHTKNLQVLLESYSSLSPTVRQKLPLVLTFRLSDNERSILTTLSRRLNIEDNVILTGFVSDDELAALYNKATMVVHPSLYEGFGLPVVEAMQCGAPIITTTSSSLPEVGGDAAILVNPTDPKAFADAMIRVYDDTTLREEMRQKGLRHAQTFSPNRLGQNTLDSYYKAVEAAKSRRKPTRPRVAIWTTPSSMSSGDSYMPGILDKLATVTDVEIFVNDGYLPPVKSHRFTHKHYSTFERRHTQCPFDVIFYQLNASSEHVYLIDAIQKWPGIVIIPDLMWGWGLFQSYKQDNKINNFRKLLINLEGKEAEKQFRGILKKNDPFALRTFFMTHLLLKDVIRSSLAQIVHTNVAKQALMSRYKAKHVFTIFPGAKDLWHGLPQHRSQFVRDEMGLNREDFFIGVLSNIDQIECLESVLKAVAQIADDYPELHLVIFGSSMNADHPQLKDLLANLDLKQAVYWINDSHGKDHDNWLLACDVVVNLGTIFETQTLSFLLQTISAGKPVIISDLPEWRDLPEAFCLRVPSDDRETQVLVEYLHELLANPKITEQRSGAARDYYEQHGTIAHMAEGYLAVAEEITGHQFSVGTSHQPRRVAGPMKSLNFNKVCGVEDFDDQELIDVIRDVFSHEIRHFTPDFPKGAEYRKYWEIGMGVRALKRFGKLNPDARILGVAAGTETTSYYLANHVGLVFATDLYLNPGVWGDFAPSFMLYEPEKVAPYPYDRNRLIVQHMDGRLLNYPDNTFDGIFSSSSIEHFGSMDLIANAAYEMGRVLKPGGILTLATEYIISGPPQGNGWEGISLFSYESLMHYIIQASGLELVDDLDTDISDETLQTERDLTLYTDELMASAKKQGRYPRVGEVVWSVYPHILLNHNGYVFTSVHLTLRKPDNYPLVPNEWAKPNQKTVRAVRDLNTQMKSAQSSATTSIPQASQKESAIEVEETNTVSEATLQTLIQRWDNLRKRVTMSRLNRLPAPFAFLARTFIRIRQLGIASDIHADSYKAILEYLRNLDQRNVSLSQRQSLLNAQYEELTQPLSTLEDTFSNQAQVFDKQVGDNTRFVNIDSQKNALEQRVRLNTSYVRMLQQQLVMMTSNEETNLVEEMPFSGHELVALIRELEQVVGPLASVGSIDISVQGSLAEEKLLLAAEYFGDRLSSRPSTYRAPNDAWYHIDFTSQWERPALFENAAIRLEPGGYFILITSNDHETGPSAPGLSLVLNQQMSLSIGQNVRVYVWQKPSANIPHD